MRKTTGSKKITDPEFFNTTEPYLADDPNECIDHACIDSDEINNYAIIERFAETRKLLEKNSPLNKQVDFWAKSHRKIIESDLFVNRMRKHEPPRSASSNLPKIINRILTDDNFSIIQWIFRSNFPDIYRQEFQAIKGNQLKIVDHSLWFSHHTLPEPYSPMDLIILFAPLWICWPSKWPATSDSCPEALCSFVKHIFVEVPVHKYFYKAWLKGDLRGIARFLLLAQGGSISSMAKYIPEWNPDISNTYVKCLSKSATYNYNIENPFLLAEIASLGGNEIEYNRLLRPHTGDFTYDCYNNPMECSFKSDTQYIDWPWCWNQSCKFNKRNQINKKRLILRDVIKWFIANRDAMNEETARWIFDYSYHKYLIAAYNGSNFTLKGRNFNKVLTEATSYYEAIHQHK